MPAPPNTSFGTAIDIGAPPTTITQNVNFGGTTFSVFYKYSASGDDSIGAFAFGDLVTYKVELHIFEDTDLVNEWLGLGSGADIINIPCKLPVRAGHVYYFKCVSHGGNVSTANLSLTISQRPQLGSSNGDLLVIEDTPANT